jgi:hypothetical protein
MPWLFTGPLISRSVDQSTLADWHWRPLAVGGGVTWIAPFADRSNKHVVFSRRPPGRVFPRSAFFFSALTILIYFLITFSLHLAAGLAPRVLHSRPLPIPYHVRSRF